MANEFIIKEGFISKSASTVQSDFTVLGNATSNSFIVNGGSEFDFLKADGTLDNTTYLQSGDTISLLNNDVGYITGFTDTFVTNFTYNDSNRLTIGRNNGETDLSVNINVMSGLTVNGIISSENIESTTVSATTYLNLPEDNNDYVVNTTFSASTGNLTLTTLSGNTVIENLDGRYVDLINNQIINGQKTFNNPIIINSNAISSTREDLIKAKVSDNINDTFIIANGTTTDSRFIPAFIGYTEGNYESLIFRGLGSSTYDVSTSEPFVTFKAANTSTPSDPNNGVLNIPTSRDLFSFGSNTTYMVMTAGGRLLLGNPLPTDDSTSKIQVSGNIKADSFINRSSDDNYTLLGGGGTKLLSELDKANYDTLRVVTVQGTYTPNSDFEIIITGSEIVFYVNPNLNIDLDNSRVKIFENAEVFDLGVKSTTTNYEGYEIPASAISGLTSFVDYKFTFWRKFIPDEYVYVTPPTYPGSVGEVGQRAYDDFFIYECVEKDTWIRAVRDVDFIIEDVNVFISEELYNTENLVVIKSATNLVLEYEPTNTVGAYYKLQQNDSDYFQNFIDGTISGVTNFVTVDDDVSLLEFNGTDTRFITNTYTSKGLMGNTGVASYTVGVWVYFTNLPTTDKWIWSAYNTQGTIGSALKITSTGLLEFHRGNTIASTTNAITTNTLTKVYVRYNSSTGDMELFVDGLVVATNVDTSTQDILLADDTEIQLGYHIATNEYTAFSAGRFRLSSALLSNAEIKGLSTNVKNTINLEDQSNPSIVEVINPIWVVKKTTQELSFTIPPNFNNGEYLLYLTNNLDQKSNKFPFVVQPLQMESSFVEDFTDPQIFSERWEALDRQWGGDNGGVVNENVYLSVHNNEQVLVCEAHGDNYTGTTQGVDRFGEPKFNPDGTPWVKRVGGVAVSKKYVGYGSFEFESKVIPVLGVASAFWNFHYQEIYPDDPRWDKYTGDYVRSGQTETGLLFQFNTLQHQNTSTAGTDTTATSFITDGANTTYGLGIKGEPNTIGETLRYQGATGYAIDFLNTTTITDPMNTDWMVMFWVKVDLEALNNARHAIISQGNGTGSLGAQAHYFSTYYEIQTGIRGDSDATVLFGTELQANYGEWYHVAFGAKNGQFIQYMNGDEKASAAVPTGTFTAQTWWRAIQNLAFAGGSAGTNPKDMSISDIRVIKNYHPTLKEVRVHYGRPYFIGKLDFNYKNLSIGGNATDGFYVVRNNEIDIEIPSHLEGGIIDEPSLANGKFNTWLGEYQNWSVTNKDNYQYWEEYRDNYRPLGIDVTDGLYHKYRYDWYPDRVEFFVDDVKIITNTDFMFGYDSLNIPETAAKLTIGVWFPSGSVLWAGKNANFEIEKMYTRRISYTPFTANNDTELLKIGETYPNASTDKIGEKYQTS